MPTPRRPDDPMRFVDLYRRGVCTALEFRGAALPAITDANVDRFLDACPADLLQILHQAVAACPPDPDDAAWASLVTIGGGIPRPTFSREELDQSDETRRQAFRDGVRVFRAAFVRLPVPR